MNSLTDKKSKWNQEKYEMSKTIAYVQYNYVHLSSSEKVGTEDRQIKFRFRECSKIQYLHEMPFI